MGVFLRLWGLSGGGGTHGGLLVEPVSHSSASDLPLMGRPDLPEVTSCRQPRTCPLPSTSPHMWRGLKLTSQ